jgi:hypothetical protein
MDGTRDARSGADPVDRRIDRAQTLELADRLIRSSSGITASPRAAAEDRPSGISK